MKCWNRAFFLSRNGCSARPASPKVAEMNAPTPLAALADIDTDPQETAEWREAFLALVATEGPQRARFVLAELARMAREQRLGWQDRKSTRLNSSHSQISYAVFCLKKKKKKQ